MGEVVKLHCYKSSTRGVYVLEEFGFGNDVIKTEKDFQKLIDELIEILQNVGSNSFVGVANEIMQGNLHMYFGYVGEEDGDCAKVEFKMRRDKITKLSYYHESWNDYGDEEEGPVDFNTAKSLGSLFISVNDQ